MRQSVQYYEYFVWYNLTDIFSQNSKLCNIVYVLNMKANTLIVPEESSLATV